MLTMILGPMKSGKSFELISHFAPLKYTDIPYALYQPEKNVRDEHIKSRNGLSIEAKKIKSLWEILPDNMLVVGIDELHMFNEKEAGAVEQLLKRGAKVIVSGLDMDYRGKMFGIVKRLLELGPKEVKYRRAVCEFCKNPEATYTQIFQGDKIILQDIPSVNVDNGALIYKAVCRNCFKKQNNEMCML